MVPWSSGGCLVHRVSTNSFVRSFKTLKTQRISMCFRYWGEFWDSIWWLLGVLRVQWGGLNGEKVSSQTSLTRQMSSKRISNDVLVCRLGFTTSFWIQREILQSTVVWHSVDDSQRMLGVSSFMPSSTKEGFRAVTTARYKMATYIYHDFK